METKRWGLSKGARRELLGMSRRLGISRKEHNNNNNMTKQEQRDTHRENCLAPDTHATQKIKKKVPEEEKRNGRRLNNKSAQLCLTLAPSHQRPTHTTTTHTRAGERKREAFAVDIDGESLQLEKQSTQVAKLKNVSPPCSKSTISIPHTHTHTHKTSSSSYSWSVFIPSRVFFHSTTLDDEEARLTSSNDSGFSIRIAPCWWDPHGLWDFRRRCATSQDPSVHVRLVRDLERERNDGDAKTTR